MELTTLRAPFDGIIEDLRVQQGNVVREGNILAALSDNSVMWVYFKVPQARYLDFISLAKDHDVEPELLLADGRRHPQSGKIASTKAQFDRETGNIVFRADFPNSAGQLRHGIWEPR